MNVKAVQQRGASTKTGPLANRKTDENSACSMAHNSVSKYLSEPSSGAQRLSFKCGQTSERHFVSVTIDEISRAEALELTDSKHFEAAFSLADNRKSLRKGCEQARKFFWEHTLKRNPFPPKQKLAMFSGKTKKVEALKPKSEKEEHVKRTASSVSLLEGTMSLTSMSSHSQLSVTSPSRPLNLKTEKKKKKNQIHDSLYKEPAPGASKSPKKSPRSQKDENRLMNTFNTSE